MTYEGRYFVREFLIHMFPYLLISEVYISPPRPNSPVGCMVGLEQTTGGGGEKGEGVGLILKSMWFFIIIHLTISSASCLLYVIDSCLLFYYLDSVLRNGKDVSYK